MCIFKKKQKIAKETDNREYFRCYQKVISVIESCKEPCHFDSAERMIRLLDKKFNDHSDEIKELFTLNYEKKSALWKQCSQ